jgi:hypothetical protein
MDTETGFGKGKRIAGVETNLVLDKNLLGAVGIHPIGQHLLNISLQDKNNKGFNTFCKTFQVRTIPREARVLTVFGSAGSRLFSIFFFFLPSSESYLS